MSISYGSSSPNQINQYEMDRMQIEFYSGRQLKAKRKKKLSCKTKIASY